MGGRGGSSRLSSVSSEQKRLMDGLIRRNAKYDMYSEPKFTKNNDGSVTYEYTREQIVTRVHGGWQSEEKNDIYRRTEVMTGKIMKDGLRRENRTAKTEVLIKKGKQGNKRG